MRFLNFKNLKTLKNPLLLGLVMIVLNASAQSLNEDCNVSDNETSKLQALLVDQKKLISVLEPNTLDLDLAYLTYVKKAVSDVDENMRANSLSGKSMVTFQTLRLVQTLISRYQNSTVFFGWEAEPSFDSIYTEDNSAVLSELKANYEEMVNVFGYDHSAYTTITANTFRDIQKILDQLVKLPINENLKKKIRSLLPALGKTIAISEQGDRPCAFIQASQISQALTDLYPDLREAATSRAGGSAVMLLIGANEYYVKFSQLDQIEKQGQCK